MSKVLRLAYRSKTILASFAYHNKSTLDHLNLNTRFGYPVLSLFGDSVSLYIVRSVAVDLCFTSSMCFTMFYRFSACPCVFLDYNE